MDEDIYPLGGPLQAQNPTQVTLCDLSTVKMRTSASLIGLTATAGVALGQQCEHQWSGAFSAGEIDAVLQARQDVEPPPLEIRPLIVSGDSSNRVDLIFFGDGCT